MGLREDVQRLRPWVSGFRLGGEKFGGDFEPPGDWESLVWARWPDVRTVLELGCCEGQRTRHLAARAERVVAVEGRAANLARARLALGAQGITNVELCQGNLETMPLANLGQFDACYIVGLLYHLPEPWRLIEQLPAVSSRVFLWTHYCRDVDATAEPMPGMPGRFCLEGDLGHGLSGLSPRSFWPTVGGLARMFVDAGMKLEIWASEPHQNGPALLAFGEKRA